jgi:quercetin dioxygenase-like cupin family protein
MTFGETALPMQVLAPGAGRAWWWFGQLAIVKARADQTRGRYTLVEVLVPPHYTTPLHRHNREDEAFWILEGEARFEVGSETVEAAEGTYLVAPRGVAHRFQAGASGARLLFLFTPGGFEQLIEATSVAAEEPTVPPPDVTPPDGADAIVRRYGTELFD